MSPNPNYQKGVRYERKIMADWKLRGHVVLRTAGSHGFWDVVAIRPGGTIELIQCKTTNSLSEAKRMIKEFRANPPMIQGNYHQRLTIKVKGGEEMECVV